MLYQAAILLFELCCRTTFSIQTHVCSLDSQFWIKTIYYSGYHFYSRCFVSQSARQRSNLVWWLVKPGHILNNQNNENQNQSLQVHLNTFNENMRHAYMWLCISLQFMTSHWNSRVDECVRVHGDKWHKVSKLLIKKYKTFAFRVENYALR